MKPYRCPICNGTGIVTGGFYFSVNGYCSRTNTTEMCRQCQGSGIIWGVEDYNHNEWVSVEERLPPDGERVIATDGNFVGEAYVNCYGVWCRCNGMRWDMFKTKVTYWMPLPELPDCRPPEGEEDA